MSDGTAIEWADATWNPVTGCSVVSPGCTNCYAMRLAGTRLNNHPSRFGLTRDTKAGPVWTGDVRLMEAWLDQPMRWRRPRSIFVCAHGDLFHESVPDEWIDRIFAVMALAPQHKFLVLTKRPKRMRAYVAGRSEVDERGQPAESVFLGVSVEDQARADERLPDLFATPAAGWFVSAEPLLETVILPGLSRLNAVIVGGESGPGARPMHPDWARSLRDQCASAGVPFFFKQWGEYDAQMNLVGKRRSGRLLDGRTHDALPWRTAT